MPNEIIVMKIRLNKIKLTKHLPSDARKWTKILSNTPKDNEGNNK